MLEKPKLENRFKDWLNLLNSYGENGKKLIRVEYRFWKYFWIKKNVINFQRTKIEKHGRFKIIPKYTKEQEDEDFKKFKESFLSGDDRKKEINKILGSLLVNLNIILEQIKKAAAKEDEDISNEVLAILLFGSSYLGPRDIEKNNETDIDLCIVVKDDFFDKKLLQSYQRGIYFNIPDEKRKIQLFFVGKDNQRKPIFTPIHFLATPYFLVKSFIDDKELNVIRNNIIDETVQEVDRLEKLISSYEITMEEHIKKQQILE